MKKILLSVSIIGVIAAVVIGITTAFFSDTETSTGNTFTAGSLDLKIDNTCHYNGKVCAWYDNDNGYQPGYYWNGSPLEEHCFCTWGLSDLDDRNGPAHGRYLFFNFNDVKPGDTGEDTISLHVYNNDSYVCAGIVNLTSEENSCNEPEKSAEPSCEADNIGELQNNLLFTVWKDTDCDNVLDSGVLGTPGQCIDGPHAGDQAIFCHPFSESECITNQTFGDCTWVPAQPGVPGEQALVQDQPATNGVWPIADSNTGGPLTGDRTYCLGVSWRIPSETGNEVQTDKLTADVSFDAVQSRNNLNFKCSDLVPPICVPTNGGVEICDGVDNDCDGTTDESDATDATSYYRDADGDGYGDVNGLVMACVVPEGYVGNSTDCNDADANINPSATEIPGDEIDQNCDGTDASLKLIVNEILFDSSVQEPGGEWIEVYNPNAVPVNLSNYKIGDAEATGDGEGMAQFPPGSIILSGQAIVIANNAVVFQGYYGLVPDFELNNSNPAVPDMLSYLPWGSAFLVQLANAFDQVLILDGSDNVVDAALWGAQPPLFGTLPFTGQTYPGLSLTRIPAGIDTDNCQVDFFLSPAVTPKTP